MPQRRTLITGGTVFDSLTGTLSRQDILIEDGTIREVAPSITADAVERIDATGKWITPGFIDMHVHMTVIGMESLPCYLGTGVTTVRDLGGDAARLKQMALDVEMGKVAGPEVIFSGPLLQQVGATNFGADRRGDGPGARPISDEASATAAVNALIDYGAKSLKIYTSVQEPIAAAILKAAEGRVPVTAHLGATSSTFVLERGIGGLEHVQPTVIMDISPPNWQAELRLGSTGAKVAQAWADVDLNGPEMAKWLRLFLDRKAFLCPTVTVTAARPPADDARLGLVPLTLTAALEARAAAAAAGAAAGGGGRGPGGGAPLASEEQINRARNNQRGFMAALNAAGGDMVIGTDVQAGRLPGYGFHSEMSAFQGRGIKPVDILKAATSVAARHLWRDDLGVVAAGRRADLVILDKDPTADIANAGSITHVMKAGARYEAAKLTAIAEPDTSKFFPAEPVPADRGQSRL